jgi:hypothetical protein
MAAIKTQNGQLVKMVTASPLSVTSPCAQFAPRDGSLLHVCLQLYDESCGLPCVYGVQDRICDRTELQCSVLVAVTPYRAHSSYILCYLFHICS